MAVVAFGNVTDQFFSGEGGTTPYLDIYVRGNNGQGNGYSYEMPSPGTPIATMLPAIIALVKDKAENELGVTFGLLDTVRIFYPSDATG